MKRLFTFVILFIFAFCFLCGCEKEKENLSEKSFREKITSASDYFCKAKITDFSNKNKNVYDVYILWEKSGRYKITTVSPKLLSGNVILFDGKALWQYNPNVESKISFEGAGGDFDGKSKIFISEFMKAYLNSSGENEEEVFFDGKSYYVYTAVIDGGNHFSKQKLWIDCEKEVPFKLETFDKEDNPVFIAEFSDFVFDKKPSDTEFSFSPGKPIENKEELQ